MSVHLSKQQDGSCALWIDGDLQFDSSDERLYHETLALPPLALAARKRPQGLSVLICGGGDGLAAREALRFPGVASVELVDLSEEVLHLAATELSQLNEGALCDPRVTVTVGNARQFLEASARQWDVILCDFTVPRSREEAAVFSREWYALLAHRLAPHGAAGINGVSPQTRPEAFWSMRATMRAGGLCTLPVRCCIPSFRKQGYGAWGFFYAAHTPISLRDLAAVEWPVPTHQADLGLLWRGARFSRAHRRMEFGAPVHTDTDFRLHHMLLNPDIDSAEPYSLEGLLNAIPITHPAQTREMIDSLAERVALGPLAVDLPRLLEHLLQRAARLPARLVEELQRLRDFLRQRLEALWLHRQWAARLFAALIITITIANAVIPDIAYAKGSVGLGRSSISRGYSGAFGGGRSFASRPAGVAASRPSFSVRGGGFRSSARRGSMVDVFGTPYRTRVYIYHSHYRSRGSSQSAAPRKQHPEPRKAESVFVADEDMLVLDNGDVVVTLTEKAYLVVSEGRVTMHREGSPEPLLEIYPEPALMQAIQETLQDQLKSLKAEIQARVDWLAWVGWTEALFHSVREDREELNNMRDMTRRLERAVQQASPANGGSTPSVKPAGGTELFAGGFLRPDGIAAVRTPSKWIYTDGRKLWDEATPQAAAGACPPELSRTLRELFVKLQKDGEADRKDGESDLRELAAEEAQLQKDLMEYRSLQSANSSDPYYEVDYGTETVTVGEAITRTERDIAENKTARDQVIRDLQTELTDRQVLSAALAGWPK
jgi:spermidine synthase